VVALSPRRQHVELLLRHGLHKMTVAEYKTHLPDKRLLEGRFKIYSQLLKNRDRDLAGWSRRHDDAKQGGLLEIGVS